MASDIITKFAVGDGKIKLSYSPTNVHPRVEYSEEFDLTDENIATEIKGLIYGTSKVSSACKRLKAFADELMFIYADCKGVSKWEIDMILGLKKGRSYGFDETFVKEIGLPMFKKCWRLDGNQRPNYEAIINYESDTSEQYHFLFAELKPTLDKDVVEYLSKYIRG